MLDSKTLVASSHGPHDLTPRSPFIEAGPIRGAYLNISNVANVSTEGAGPEDGIITCFGTRAPGLGIVNVGLTLESGWRLLVTFKSRDHKQFNWTSFMFGDIKGEVGDVQFDTAVDRFYFVTPSVSGSIPPAGSISTFSVLATNPAGDWSIESMQLTALS